MKNLTARTNERQAENSSRHEAGKSQHQPGVRKTYKSPIIDARLFYDPTDGRKWKPRCEQKRTVWIGLLDISHGQTTVRGTEDQVARLKRMPRRTVRWVIRMFRTQGFHRDLRKHGLNGAMERELLPDRLGKYEPPPAKRVARTARAEQCSGESLRESCRTSTRESCRVKAVGKLQLGVKADTADTAAKTAAGSYTAPFNGENKETGTFQAKSKITNTQEKASLGELDWSRPGNRPVRKTNTQHTPQSAFDTAVRVFRSSTWFKIAEPYATGLASWIASRSLRATNCHPRTVTYYTESARNFFEQYSEAQQEALMLEGPDRYQAEIDRLHGRPDRKRPHRHLSAAEQREAKNEEVLKRVFGDHPEDPDGWF